MRKYVVLLVWMVAVVPVLALDNDGSGQVDLGDVQTLASNWLLVDEPLNVADLSGDDDVNILDFELVASQWLDLVTDIVVSDHVSQVIVSNYINYNNPDIATDTAYHFELQVATDGQVTKIYFESPVGNIFAIPSDTEIITPVGDGVVTTRRAFDDGSYVWLYDASFPTDAGLADYGDGTITVTAFFADGRRSSTDIWFGEPGSSEYISQPLQEPEITSFTNNSILSSPVTFEWELPIDSNVNYIALESISDIHDDITDTNGPLWLYATGLGDPLELGAGDWLEKLAYINTYPKEDNIDGVEVLVSKYTEIDYTITVTN